MKRVALWAVLLCLIGAGICWAEEAANQTGAVAAIQPDGQAKSLIDTGDTAWMLISIALVMLMTPGLAFFYGGMVRRKNVLGVLMQCFIVLGVITAQWILFGYSLSFAPGKGFWGGFDWLGLCGVGAAPFKEYAATIPHEAFMIFQAMFAVITPALIIGAFAERMKFSAFLIFTVLWATFVYDPVCHWIWGVGGWLKDMGVLDFAGGAVVHINAGMAALVTALVIGKRTGYANKPVSPHNLPFTVLGTALLWFGWFGFNAGSALGANGLAVHTLVVTHTSAAIAGITWAALEWIFNEKPTIFGTITGSIAGLATITPASGFVTVFAAAVIGFLASVVCYVSVAIVKPKLGYDDSLDAFGVHGVGGILGMLATGLFASKAVNPAGADGLFYGNPKQFLIQLVGVGVTVVYSFVVSYIIYKIIDVFMKVRVPERDETIGLDLTQHHENAYTILE
ncbi:MAG: ammonia channel protein [Syntrophus sp. (in: bacteria)]|nr:ammonia channel protein [Syntrophus sp. (in: bacteria)]